MHLFLKYILFTVIVFQYSLYTFSQTNNNKEKNNLDYFSDKRDWDFFWSNREQDDPAENVILLSSFIHKHPNSEFAKEVYSNLGINYYKLGDFNESYENFKRSLSYGNLSSEATMYYVLTKEMIDYYFLMNSENLELIENYLKKHPEYYILSDRYALLLAKRLTIYNTDKDFDYILGYAKTKSTKKRVKNIIANIKYQQREDNNYDNVWKDRFLVGVGLDLNTLTDNGEIGLGIFFKYGKYSDLVNFNIGFKYIFAREELYKGNTERNDDYYDDWDDYPCRSLNSMIFSDNYENQYVDFPQRTQFISIPVNLKLNLFNLKQRKIFLGGGIEYGLNHSNKHYVAKNNFSIIFSTGIMSKHFEFNFYYKYYMNKIYTNNSFQADERNRIGIQYIYYLKI